MRNPIPTETIRKARALWALGLTDEEIGARFRFRPEAIAEWRKWKRPDGVPWEVVREQIEAGASADEAARLLGPVTEEEQRKATLTRAQQLQAMYAAALQTRALYDEDQNQVTVLYDEAGEPVSVTGWPNNSRDALKGLEVTARIAKGELEALAKLEAAKSQRDSDRLALVEGMAKLVVEVLGWEAWDQLRVRVVEAVDVSQEVADEVEVKMLGLEGNRTGEEAEVEAEVEVEPQLQPLPLPQPDAQPDPSSPFTTPDDEALAQAAADNLAAQEYERRLQGPPPIADDSDWATDPSPLPEIELPYAGTSDDLPPWMPRPGQPCSEEDED